MIDCLKPLPRQMSNGSNGHRQPYTPKKNITICIVFVVDKQQWRCDAVEADYNDNNDNNSSNNNDKVAIQIQSQILQTFTYYYETFDTYYVCFHFIDFTIFYVSLCSFRVQ